jgi:hypothetical protein
MGSTLHQDELLEDQEEAEGVEHYASEEVKAEGKRLLEEEYPELLEKKKDPARLEPMVITLMEGASPVASMPRYQRNAMLRGEFSAQVQELLDADIIEPSTSPWTRREETYCTDMMEKSTILGLVLIRPDTRQSIPLAFDYAPSESADFVIPFLRKVFSSIAARDLGTKSNNRG